MSHDHLRRLWALFAVFALGVTLFDLLSTGVSFEIGVIRLSTRDAARPFAIAVLCGAVAIWQSDRRSPSLSSWSQIAGWSRGVTAISALLTVLVGIHFGIFVAGGADAYGYVSQATLWATGHLTVPERLATLTPSLGTSAAPLGFKLAPTPGSIVPTYPAGLPLMMAIGLRLGGPAGVYYVVPVLGGLAVWLTYVIGTRVGDRRAGLIAAVLLACSPTFLLQLFEPMSDVPATAFWLLAIAWAMSDGSGRALLAGLAATVAILIRPNLAPLLVVVGFMAMTAKRRWSRAILFAIGAVPGCVAVAVINRSLYGSVVGSGYGPFDTLFQWSRLGANLRTYPYWLLQLYSVFVLLAFASPLMPIDAADDAAATGSGTVAIRRWLLLGFAGMLFLCYAFYIPYDTWPFLRFLLPSIPLLLVLSATVAVWVIGRLPQMLRGASMLVLCGLLGTSYMVRANDRHIFLTQASEHRYVAVGEYVERELPPNAVVITVIQSGSIRFYGHRPTVRWDQLPPDGLDAAASSLEANGYLPYILVEDWEESEFVRRFGHTSAIGQLQWPPVVQYNGFQRVRIYAVRDRARALAGQTIVTTRIGTRVR